MTTWTHAQRIVKYFNVHSNENGNQKQIFLADSSSGEKETNTVGHFLCCNTSGCRYFGNSSGTHM